MIIFIKKIKTKDGINAFDAEKIKKSIPAGYNASAEEPTITLTGNHIVIAYKCEKVAEPKPEPKPDPKPKAKKKAKKK